MTLSYRLIKIGVIAFLFTVFVLSCSKKSESTDLEIKGKSGKVLSPDSVSIHYQVRGMGSPALVFIHGWSCDQSYWQQQVNYFSKTHRVVTLDLGGHGQSGLNRQKYSMEVFGKDVVTVINELKLGEVVILGHSMGGSVVLEAAKMLPDQIIGVVGVDTYQDFDYEYPEDEFEVFLTPFKNDFKQTTIGFVKSMFPATADSALVEQISSDMASAPPEVALASFNAYFSYNPKTTLKKLKVPVRSINSPKYPVDIEGNQRMTRSFEVIFMDEVGHFLMMEDPLRFNKILEEILDEFSGE